MSELFYAFLLAGCIGALVTWLFVRLVFRALLRMDDRRALEAHERAISCPHGHRKWSTIKCPACAADFKAEAERERAANPTILGVDLASGKDQTVVMHWTRLPDGRLIPFYGDRRDEVKARWERSRGPGRMNHRLNGVDVAFDHEDYGLQLVEDQRVAINSRYLVYSAKLTGHLDGYELEEFVTVDKYEAELDRERKVSDVRMLHLRRAMNEMAGR